MTKAVPQPWLPLSLMVPKIQIPELPPPTCMASAPNPPLEHLQLPQKLLESSPLPSKRTEC